MGEFAHANEPVGNTFRRRVEKVRGDMIMTKLSGTKMWLLYHGGSFGEYSECSIFDVSARELFDDEDIAKKREVELNEENADNEQFFTYLVPLVVGELDNDDEDDDDE